MLKGEREPAPDLDDLPIEAAETLFKQPVPVEYNPAFPIEEFDLIIIDECHRSIYNLWKGVLDYFDAFQVGLTATPSAHTLGYFNQNLVSSYTHEQAVLDKVNVGYDIYRIRTKLTEKGATVERGNHLEKIERRTRRKRWEKLKDDYTWQGAELDRSVLSDNQVRTVLTHFREALFTKMFPHRSGKWIPKTLVYAKDDSHADRIVDIARDVFGEGNDFCKKITYRSGGKKTAKDLIAEFRTSPQLRIAVTVDMIATGTDIKPLEIVLFLRGRPLQHLFRADERPRRARGVRHRDGTGQPRHQTQNPLRHRGRRRRVRTGARPIPVRWKRNPPSTSRNCSMPPRWARPKSPPWNLSPDASSGWNAASMPR